MKTNDLRKLIRNKLLELPESFGIKEVSYQIAENKEMYPHIVFSFDREENVDKRSDYRLDIDVYDKGTPFNVEDIADDIEEMFRQSNLPQATILPTFYAENRRRLPDEDKSIQHILLKFIIQNYEREA